MTRNNNPAPYIAQLTDSADEYYKSLARLRAQGRQTERFNILMREVESFTQALGLENDLFNHLIKHAVEAFADEGGSEAVGRPLVCVCGGHQLGKRVDRLVRLISGEAPNESA
jgi:Mg2+ and Co2+ transporter CorA